MSATEELRRMLDERGLSHPTHYLYTSWSVGSKLYVAMDNLDGTLTVENLTPEQAIAATLGGDCEVYMPELTCNLIEDEDGVSLHCSNCGGAAEKRLWAYWHYCPNCRAKVVGE